ncbi:hypothetical protein [Chitinophaga sp.]|uniref:hypothetical protein n=1 Tax=Chitinophaga sp. TaxID=1869181 RepID=UPI002616C428|nr:hypothetical protein [uncultured Chitinophaga sp.]
MKKLIILAALLGGAFTVSAQSTIIPHEYEKQDSIFYQVPNAVLIVDKLDVEDYFKNLDTVLVQKQFNKTVFRNIQFSPLSPEEVQRHYGLASKFWTASKSNPLSYSTDRITLFWNDNEGIILPYIDEILPDLLEAGKVQVVDRTTNKRVKLYKMDYEDVNGKSFRIFRLEKGKVIWRESEVFIEQVYNAGR